MLKNNSSSSNNNHVFIKDKYKIINLNLEEVLRLEAMDNYTQIFTSSSKIIVNIFLKDVLSKINSNSFIRIHKSHVVNINKVDYIVGNILFVSGLEVPIGRKFRAELIEKLDVLS